MKRYLFGRFVLDMPDNHKIVGIHREHYLYDRLCGLVLEEIASHHPSDVFLDIGANIGDTAAVMASHAANPIVSVEGGDEFLPFLRTNAKIVGPQIKVVEGFVRPQSLVDHQVWYESRDGSGALLPLREGERPVSLDRFVSITEVLEEAHALGPSVGLVKTDTDGFDGFLLLELMEVTCCPLFFECNLTETFSAAPTPWPDVFRELSRRKFAVVVFDNFGLPLCAAKSDVGDLLSDLSGNIHMQHCAGRVRTHYLDVWAFPQDAVELFQSVTSRLRNRYLKPYGF